jgi:hypothetical protein
MENNFFFLAGLSFILVHEMDAVRCQEWTIIPLLSRLRERTGYWVFTAIHIPLYLLLLSALYRPTPGLVVGLDVFFVVHIFLHVLFLKHPKHQFTSAFSWTMILGAGSAGLIDIILRSL